VISPPTGIPGTAAPRSLPGAGTADPFRFHQTGAKLIKDGKLYYIRRCYQHEQAKKAGVDYK
jgi:hypothetical protein